MAYDKKVEDKIKEILDKSDQLLEAIVEDLMEAGFNSACHFISHVNPNIRVSFIYEDVEEGEEEESLTISSQCAELFLDYLDKDELLEEFMRRQVMLLASELDKVNRELKLIQYASWKDQMIEDREGIQIREGLDNREEDCSNSKGGKNELY